MPTWDDVHPGQSFMVRGRIYVCHAREGNAFVLLPEGATDPIGPNTPGDMSAEVVLLGAVESVALQTNTAPVEVAGTMLKVLLGATEVGDRYGDGSWQCPRVPEGAELAVHLLMFHGGSRHHEHDPRGGEYIPAGTSVYVPHRH